MIIDFTSRVFIISLLVASISLSGCVSVSKVIGGRHKYDHAQNFEIMQRYNFYPVPEKIQRLPEYRYILDSGATLVLENAMAAKLIRKERYATPDFWLNFYYVGEKSITTGELNKLNEYNLGLAWDDKYGTGEGIANIKHRFSSGQFIIDLVSKTQNRLIWRGSTATGIDPEDAYEQRKKKLTKAVEVIMSPFPPENNFSSLKSGVLEE
jgi:hypothetical protein